MEGKTLSHFRIDSRIGAGGMGVVYQAEDLKLRRTVAIKVLPSHLMGDQERAARFMKEARAAAAVTHRNIATVHEIDEADGVIFIAMELVEGDTLRSLIERSSLTLGHALHLAQEIAEGLAAAHEAGIVHRDLKPDNVIVTKDGHAKIIDFGLARLLEEQPAPVSEDDETVLASKTRDGMVIGTPTYMSPEQARGLEVDFRTDLFSFGSTFYEMVTGAPPFKAATTTDILSDILHKVPQPVAGFNPEIPSSVQWVLDKCLDKDVDRRYQNTRDLVVDLQHLAPAGDTSDTSFTSVLPSRSAAQARPWWQQPLPVALAALALVLVIVGLPWLLRGDRAGAPVPQANSLAVFMFENLKDVEDPERLGQILQELLITDLSGGAVKVFSSQRLYDLQKQVQGRDAGRTGAKESATAVARRAGAQHMLTGSLSQISGRWMLTTQLADVQTGTVLQSNRIDGTDLFQIADQLSEQIVTDLPGAILEEGIRMAVKDKTTSSVEAYQTYLAGVDLLNDEQYDLAADELEKALEIDPKFSQAYSKLAIARWWAGESLQGAEEPLKTLLSGDLYLTEKERLFAEGTLAMVARDFGDALPIFQRLSREHRDEKEVWYSLGEALFHFPGGGREDEAAQAFERAVELDPEFALAYKHLYDHYRNEKKYDEAVARFRRLRQQSPGKPLFHRYLAAALELAGEEAAVDKALADALEVNTTPGERQDLYTELARAARRRPAPEREAAYLEKALAADPESQSASLSRLLLQNLQGQLKYEEVADLVRRELERNPNNPTYRFSNVFLDIDRHRGTDALAQMEQWNREAPGIPPVALTMASLSILWGGAEQQERAIAEAQKLHTTPAQQVNFNQALGTAFRNSGDTRRGLEFFQRAREADPDQSYPSLLFQLGLTLSISGELDKAEAIYQEGLKVNPKHWGLHIGLMYLSLFRGDYDRAMEQAEVPVTEAPQSSSTHRFRILAHLVAGELDDADALVQEALNTLATKQDRWQLDTDPNHGVGWMCLSLGLLDRAEASFRRGMALDPEVDPKGLTGLGFVALRQGELVQASDTFRNVLDRNPRHPSALQGLTIVRLLEGEVGEAQRLIGEMRNYGPLVPLIDELQTYVLLAQGRPEEARALAEELLAKNPLPSTKELLAWTLVAGDLDLEGGVLLATEALEEQMDVPFDPHRGLGFRAPAQHTLGLARLKRGDAGEAVKHLQKAAELSPHRPSLQQHLRQAQAGG